MQETTNTIQEILNAAFMIGWPLLDMVIAIAGILLFRAEKRHYNLCIIIGGALAGLVGIVRLVYMLPGVGLLSKGSVDPAALPKFFLFTGAINTIALAMIAYGILMHAIVFLKTRQNAILAEDLHR